ncbi:hypothetical protein N7481_009215 [Penicillium waksmanii]|uniref:uncharacterized protein n=1 Tax=Penicillium waksmanii TaxID=69791 RepID=UPI002548A087|nr:uncharacterized protein N7481_009215 [Penicillium waksmanii]KAJ5975508.1 hypothetical protein N7481_009215 [Penicillium waksmanii]
MPRCRAQSWNMPQYAQVLASGRLREIQVTDFNILIQHPGPILAYMSKAPGDVREYDGSEDWFKNAEEEKQRHSLTRKSLA